MNVCRTLIQFKFKIAVQEELLEEDGTLTPAAFEKVEPVLGPVAELLAAAVGATADDVEHVGWEFWTS